MTLYNRLLHKVLIWKCRAHTPIRPTSWIELDRQMDGLLNTAERRGLVAITATLGKTSWGIARNSFLLMLR